jgi:hypothetical protein
LITAKKLATATGICEVKKYRYYAAYLVGGELEFAVSEKATANRITGMTN